MRTALHACIRHYGGTRFVFTKDRQRIVNGVFLATSQPFCRDISVVRLRDVPLASCALFTRQRFGRTKGDVAGRAVRAVCRRFSNVA